MYRTTEVQLSRDGVDQTVKIPQEFELAGTRALIRRDGDRLIIEPVRQDDLLDYLQGLDPAGYDIGEVDDNDLPPLDEPNV